jgi:hypothetical protein
MRECFPTNLVEGGIYYGDTREDRYIMSDLCKINSSFYRALEHNNRSFHAAVHLF